MKEAKVQIGDGKMFYRYAGQGKPLILMHSMGFSSELWHLVMEPLSKKFTVYALDLIGHFSVKKPAVNAIFIGERGDTAPYWNCQNAWLNG